MFTGIIEEIGTVRTVKKVEQGAVISINCTKILDDINLGDSVAVDGACQTVVMLKSDGFDVEASQETLNLTTFESFTAGKKVNLERAMQVKSRLGGHIVTGHIDGTGVFEKKVNQGLADIYFFSAPEEVSRYLVYKGSVCINGISLTVASIKDNTFSISVIPHTVNNTALQYLKYGDKVNLESDILAKYVEKFLNKSNNKDEAITMDYLSKHGFM